MILCDWRMNWRGRATNEKRQRGRKARKKGGWGSFVEIDQGRLSDRLAPRCWVAFCSITPNYTTIHIITGSSVPIVLNVPNGIYMTIQ